MGEFNGDKFVDEIFGVSKKKKNEIKKIETEGILVKEISILLDIREDINKIRWLKRLINKLKIVSRLKKLGKLRYCDLQMQLNSKNKIKSSSYFSVYSKQVIEDYENRITSHIIRTISGEVLLYNLARCSKHYREFLEKLDEKQIFYTLCGQSFRDSNISYDAMDSFIIEMEQNSVAV